MNIVVLHGSPRMNGNSDTLAAEFLSGLKTESPRIDHFYLNDMDINPCQGCLYCASSPLHRCRIDDDMGEIYRAFQKGDLVVWATPMYWGYMTAQMKTALDRMEALVMGDHFRDKIFVVLITYRYHCASTVAFFERISPFFGVDLHVLTCRTMDEKGEKDLSVHELPDILDATRAIASRITEADPGNNQ